MTTFTFFTGKNIKANPAETLTNISIKSLYDMLTGQKELRHLIESLRHLLAIDKKKYQQAKLSLPYFIGASFEPAFRKTDNFVSIQNFVIDLDHIFEKGGNIAAIFSSLRMDPRVLMMFTSPGGDGLKVVFTLREKCFDARQYSLFYKKFVSDFSAEHNLEDYIDTCTSDVTRICFLSYDPEAYLNLDAKPISMKDHVDFGTSIFEASHYKAINEELLFDNNEVSESGKMELNKDVLDDIMSKLNPDRKTKPEKQIFVPEILEQIVGPVKEKASAFNIQLKEVKNINYGKKFVFEMERAFAEINVFYGKNGFSIVKTPKKGSSEKLCDAMHHLLSDLLY
jgi:hypothetical protein